jgi:hypothetical protein
MALELELLLRTGRAKDVREAMTPEDMADHKAALGTASYYWIRAQALAATGDYALAEGECEQLATDGRGQGSARAQEVMALLTGQVLLDEQPVGAFWPQLPWRALGRLQWQQRLAVLAKGLRQQANANVLRGLLALEEGSVDEAEVAFRLALALWQDETRAASGAGLDFNTRPIALSYLRLLE